MSNPLYQVAHYGEMMADPVRMGAYQAALRAACRPGCVVLDIGTGTGIMALLACRFGARRVYAIEPSDVIGIAREIVTASGFADRITFIQGISTEVSLEEPADVIVADVRGVLPLMWTSVATMIDARRRLLAPGGAIIPARDRVLGALVEHPVAYDDIVKPWSQTTFPFDFTPARNLVLQHWRKTVAPTDGLLTPTCDLFELDYRTIENPTVSGTLDAVVTRTGTAHGVCAWFDAELFDGIGFSNGPGHPRTIYGQGFFPLPRPVAVETGDRAKVELRAIQVQADYTWCWDTAIMSADGLVKARFSQSTFHAVPLSVERLQRLNAEAAPVVGAQGAIDRFVVDRLDGRTTLTAIAAALREAFPERFPDLSSALARATDVTGRFLD
jgi:protein arginine N-methyltransferase 1